MEHEVKQTQLKGDLVKLLMDSRNKAELMRAMSEMRTGETRELCQEVAESFSLSVWLIERLIKTL